MEEQEQIIPRRQNYLYKNLKNLNEAILWASSSCALGFFSRLMPTFIFPIMMLRLSITIFCLYNVSNAPSRGARFSYGVIGGAMLFGFVGSYWDYIEILIHYESDEIASVLGVISLIAVVLLGLHYWSKNKNDK
jgi:hypothetical protein